MISIITAIYNQLDMNKLFYEYLIRYTQMPFELIIIDNNSTDGSAEFFRSKQVKVISNNGNYPYPYCQNQGIEQAKGELLAFLNNDLLVGKNWDTKCLEIMKNQNLDVAFCSTNEKIETKKNTSKIYRRWKFIRKPLVTLFGTGTRNLRFMHWLMYGNWEKFTENRYAIFKESVIPGISGSAVLLTRKGLNVLGMFDNRIQAGDFDLYLRAKERALKHHDIKQPLVMLGVFVHHYVRLTAKHFYPPFVTASEMIKIETKWSKQYANELLADSGHQIV